MPGGVRGGRNFPLLDWALSSFLAYSAGSLEKITPTISYLIPIKGE
jgi:hypothetical protein